MGDGVLGASWNGRPDPQEQTAFVRGDEITRGLGEFDGNSSERGILPLLPNSNVAHAVAVHPVTARASRISEARKIDHDVIW
jgi:hypothetical protein